MVNLYTLWDIIISGLGLGSIYALVAIGFTLIYKITDVLNFAQGQIAALGAYGIIFAIILGAPPLVAVLITVSIGIVLGYILEWVIFRHFIGEPILSVIIVTLALGDIIRGSIMMVTGPGYKAYPTVLDPAWSISLPFQATISAPFAAGVVLAFLIMGLLMVFFRTTVHGSILQGAASDQQAALMLGISIRRTIVIAWSISIFITILGGLLLGMTRGGAALSIGSIGIIIFAAVVLGGLDSIPGAFIGSMVIGLLEQLGAFYLNPIVAPGFGRIVPMIVLLAVLLVKPYGLFGTERIERL
jgi:branched-chain amino acid transport system permease protein